VDTDIVSAGLTSIADAAVQAALAAATRQLAEERGGLAGQLVVVGMGRFGGAEMGYSSDADVLFVAGPAPGAADADPSRVIADATAIADLLTRLLGRPSPDPPLLVDADLRPEGKSGPMVRTVESYQQYWQRHAAPWERQALLRARPVAGDAGLAGRFLAAADEFRYPAAGLPAEDVREIRRIKARVDTERLGRGVDPTLHTKLGRGGLADVEWTVQLLQLRHAGRQPALRCPGTLPTLRAATEVGLLDPGDASALAEGWTTATRVRNAIMLVTGRPGDLIPVHGRVLAGIARACGFPAGSDPGEFVDAYRRATRRARQVVDRLFDRD
jgi:glutamate-ammonia-ligase adenylyltransferase